VSRISRTAFLRQVGAAFAGIAIERVVAAQGRETAADRRVARISELLRTFDAQGVHRTGTLVDNASAEWLRKWAASAGAEVRLVPFEVDRIDVRAAHVAFGDERLEGLPFFDGGFTSEAGIAGRLGLVGSEADIVLVTLDQTAIGTEGQSLAPVRRDPRYRGVVAVTTGGAPGLCPSNARAFAAPYGIPVIQVSSEHRAVLDQAAAAQRSVTLVASVGRSRSPAYNVVGTVSGRRPGLAPLVVMTPRSGWWQCASERGGGLACWVESVRAVSAAKPVRPVTFIASSGHELGHFGLDQFLRDQPDLIKAAHAWIHLGANISAARGQMRLQASDDAIEASLARALDAAGAPVTGRVARGTVPGGEARNIHVGGGRYVSLLGSGPAFHTTNDRWPDAVDLNRVTRCAQAVAGLAVELSKA
jgi:hypothetical protein